MHNCAFSELHIDADYHVLNVTESDLPAVVARLKREGAAGWNVTMPDKTAMFHLCEVLSDSARIGQSVNTVRNEHGVLHGYTTDGDGFLLAMREEGFPVTGANLTLLGTGGAASSILIACALDSAASVRIFYHQEASCARMLEIKERLMGSTKTKIDFFPLTDAEAVRTAVRSSQALINATSVGMAGTPLSGLSPLPDALALPERLCVFDIIYNPRTTPLLADAKKAGCRTANGLSMLLNQGAEAFRIWTGREMPLDTVRRTVFPNG
ncbi:MAG: shikimate dehydrogenase family protein [Lachnospiraceae bacterium]